LKPAEPIPQSSRKHCTRLEQRQRFGPSEQHVAVLAALYEDLCDAGMRDAGCTMMKVPNREKRLAIKATVPNFFSSVSAGLVVCTPVAIGKRTYRLTTAPSSTLIQRPPKSEIRRFIHGQKHVTQRECFVASVCTDDADGTWSGYGFPQRPEMRFEFRRGRALKKPETVTVMVTGAGGKSRS
jgi:hypothetical protein